MRYSTKVDWWIGLGIVLGVLAPAAGPISRWLHGGLPTDRLAVALWPSGLLLVFLLLLTYPVSYETASEGLVVRSGLFKRRIPYAEIRRVLPDPGGRGGIRVALSMDLLRVEYGDGKACLISPAEEEAFLAELSMRTPHLVRVGSRLTARDGLFR